MRLFHTTGRLAAVILSLLALLQQVFAISWSDDMPSGITIASAKRNLIPKNARKHLGIYVGGPIYKEERRAGTLAELMSSKFTEVIVWSVHVDPDGTLDLNKEFPIVKDGAYIGAQQHPSFANDLRQLRDSGRRVTLGFGAAGSPAFNNIRDLLKKGGAKPGGGLRKNFEAVRRDLSAITFIDLNDEVTYDASSMTEFSVMLADLGFKVSLCPYTNRAFWQNVAGAVNSQRPGAIQAVNLQCYGGGRRNNPADWSFPGIPVYPGVWAEGTDSGGRAVGEETINSATQRYTDWRKSASIPGGFVWLYD
ncbi:MAG: hypothetical protein ACKPGI_00270, partial [Verrucomicrobiota bacterium]